MAQIDPDLYKTIADAYAAIDNSLSGVSTQARVAVDAIVDISTTGYPDPSANPDAALELELALLTPFNTAFVGSSNLANSTGSILDAVRAINNHVINNSDQTGTATVKLNYWINTHMNTTWDGNVVPTGWKNLCADAGYATATWS
ncbi:MAG: hypothetical protein ABGF52_11340 [Candidatus Asgardarchaeum sp.]